MKKNIKVVITIAITLLIELVVSALFRGYLGGMISSGIVSFLLYAVLLYFIGKEWGDIKIYGWIVVGVVLVIQVILRGIWWTESLISLPESIMHLLGIGAGILIYKSGKNMKIVWIALSILILVFYSLIWQYWLPYTIN